MARRTAKDFLEEMDLAFGGPSATIPKSAMKLRWLNTAYTLDIAGGYDHRELTGSTTTATVSAQAYVDHTATDILMLKDPVDSTSGGPPITEIDQRYYDRLMQGSSTSNTGSPQHWYQRGVTTGKLPRCYISPTPDGIYSLVWPYRKRPTLLVLSPFPTSTVLPEEWDESLLNFAIAYGWGRMGDVKKMQAYKANAIAAAGAALRISGRLSGVHHNMGGFIHGAVNG